jgi:hypothetical protein
MKFIRLEKRPVEWDRHIAVFPNKTLFHESVWLDFIVATNPHANVEYFEIREGSDCVGYFCPIKVRKYFLNFWEGPHDGSIFMNMSPLAHSWVDKQELIVLVMAACKKEGIAHLTLCDPCLDPHLMERLGFVPERRVSQVCSLSEGKDLAWAKMAGTCRTRIRKAEKNGLIVESVTNQSSIDESYSLFATLLACKGKSPGYSLDYMRQLFSHLWKTDRILALQAKHDGRVIATAYYLHDERAMYFGNVAYDVKSLPLCPNNLLHWTAMQIAIEMNIPLFYMGGDPLPSRFTRKFGGTLQPVTRYHRSFVPLLHQARQAYHLLSKLNVWT